MSESAIIALGSNLGDPLLNLQRALIGLRRCGTVEAASHIYRAAPVGGPEGQPDYLNAVIVLEPSAPYASPSALLEALLEIEHRQGRVRRIRWDARTLDLDLIAYGRRTVDEPGLTVPHPRVMERAFVLAPLCELLPDWRHPVTGEAACEVLEALESGDVVRTDLPWEAR